MPTKKYIFENGVMKINPIWQAEQNKQGMPTTVANPDKAIAIVSSTEDVEQATQVQQEKTGKPMQLAEATTATMEMISDNDYLDRFKTKKPIDGNKLLDDLSKVLARYEIPIGLANKLVALTEYKMNFIIDDSGSMDSDTDSIVSSTSEYVKSRFTNKSRKLTRWEEVEDRIHIMIDILKFIPIDPISISFMNRSDKLTLNHDGKDPEEFAKSAHAQITDAFKKGPTGGTPTYRVLNDAFNSSKTQTLHYLFTDGRPSDDHGNITDAEVEKVKKLVKNRANPHMSPLTFVTCTDEDAQVEWIKDIEEEAPFVAELDDFDDEKAEVFKKQGPAFPFSRGFWLINHLVAAINPDDLDAMDESTPFSKMTMDNLMGRVLTAQEYQNYFNSNPNARKYTNLLAKFETEQMFAKKIIEKFGNTSTLSSTLQSMWSGSTSSAGPLQEAPSHKR